MKRHFSGILIVLAVLVVGLVVVFMGQDRASAPVYEPVYDDVPDEAPYGDDEFTGEDNPSIHGENGLEGVTPDDLIDPVMIDGVSCTDTDGGMNYDVKGTVVDVRGGIDTDKCSLSDIYAGRLYEFSCDADGTYFREEYDCPNGCSDGACLVEAVVEETEVVEEVEVVEEEPVVEVSDEELLMEYSEHLGEDMFRTTYIAVYPTIVDAKVGDDLLFLLRVKNTLGTYSTSYHKVLTRGTAKNWITNSDEDISSYAYFGPVASSEPYIDFVVKLTVGDEYGLYDEFTTTVGSSYRFEANPADAKFEAGPFNTEDKKAAFIVNVVE
jgi:hypothetical protein